MPTYYIYVQDGNNNCNHVKSKQTGTIHTADQKDVPHNCRLHIQDNNMFSENWKVHTYQEKDFWNPCHYFDIFFPGSSDLDDNSKIDKFEVIFYQLQQQNKYNSQIDCYKDALETLEYFAKNDQECKELLPKYKKILKEKIERNEYCKKTDGSISRVLRNAGYESLANFLRDDWAGEKVRKFGLEKTADWLEDKDKKCTDGKDDGKIGLWEGTKSLVKGIVGGIPKMMVNHPVTTAATIAAGAAAVAVTGGAILPVLGAAGVVTGVGMAGYGTYKAATAKTDGDAKQALETLGTGVTTTALSAISAGKTLDKAAEAGVKSAQVSKDAGIIEKTVQMFKATPEALKLSGKNAKFNMGFHVEGAYKKYSDDKYRSKILVEEKTPGGVVKKYERGSRTFKKDESLLIEEKTANGTVRTYRTVEDPFRNYSVLTEERFADGSYRKYEYKYYPTFKKDYSSLSEEGFANGEIKKYNSSGQLTEHILADGTRINYENGTYGISTQLCTEFKPDGSKLIRTKDGTVLETFDKDGNLVESLISKKFNSDGTLSQSTIDELEQMGIKVRYFCDRDNDQHVTFEYLLNDTQDSHYINGKLHWVSNNKYTTTYYDENTGMKTRVHYSSSSKVTPSMIDWQSYCYDDYVPNAGAVDECLVGTIYSNEKPDAKYSFLATQESTLYRSPGGRITITMGTHEDGTFYIAKVLDRTKSN